MNTELYHYGIPGMKWGIRRYQNKDGSLTPAGEKRLNNYKTKESERISRKYQVDKLSEKRKKLETKFEERYDDAALNRLTRANYKLLKAQTMEFLEKRKVDSMTYEEMIKERAEVRKAKKFMSELESMVIDSITDIDVLKTNRRVSLEESIYTEYEARMNTGYKGL